MLQRSLSLFSSPKYTARQGAMWTAAFHLVMLSWQWINPAFGGPLEASFHLCILQRPNGFFESFFFFFPFLFLDGRKRQERLTLKFLWMPLLLARMSRLAHWDNIGYQRKVSATHLSPCTAVCRAVLSVPAPKPALYIEC